MKVIVLGGAGDMGSRTVEDLADAEDVSRITVADRNKEAAEALVNRLQGKKVQLDFMVLDANDHRRLVESIRHYDVVASALGPFFLFEEKLFLAAIEAGVDYCSLCDEWKPTETVLDTLDEPAREKGVTAITGLGASPGITNMEIRHMTLDLDRTVRARAAVFLPLDCGVGGAAMRHGLHIMSGKMLIWRNRKWMRIGACSEKRTVEFPRFGKVAVWNMGHSEPVTLPRTLTDLEGMEFYMGFGTGTSLIVQLARWNLFAGKRKGDAFAKILNSIERLITGKTPGPGAVRVDVWGEKDGRPVHRMRCGTGLMRETTGLALSVGALMLGRRQLTEKSGGVFAPEARLDPDIFLVQLKARGVESFEDLAMTRPTIGSEPA